jgi:S1-C subfamily serine protease
LPDGPAKRAGLLVGDILLRIDGVPVPTLQAMRAALAGKTGSDAQIELSRGGMATTLRLEVGAWPARQRHC